MKTQIDYIKILRDAVKDERIAYFDTLRACQKDFNELPLSKAAAEAGQEAWVANFEIKTLGENFKKLYNPIHDDYATNYVVFDLLKRQFIVVKNTQVKTPILMNLSATDLEPLRMKDVIFSGELDNDEIDFYQSFWELDVNSLFKLFAENKTEKLIEFYKNALLKRIDRLEEAIKNMSQDNVCFNIFSDDAVFAPIETYYGDAQTVYEAYLDKADSEYYDAPKHILESILVLGLCDDAQLQTLSSSEFSDKIKEADVDYEDDDRDENFTTNDVIHWLSLKNQFDSLYR